ncbi:TonB-dependent receptor [Pseudomonas sp. RIT-PI-AD]|uniref:TonB-dependent receptor n=1 Tax=Pseudomonas sp. RIT-PI-AD TaxID=3035294 RepID=UPI0021D9B9E6|nr:TonB-dependent receptor [Pseudomonas sp. RIT-PI-AD]
MRRILWLALFGGVMPVPGFAGEGAGAVAEPLLLETSTITARRREENAQAVPLSVGVLDGDSLDDAGLHRLRDIQRRVPGLVVSGHNPRYAGFGLRGFGATPFNDGLDGSVGVFVDGVYQGRPGMAFADMLDVERIEVLRGPQGTLFGRNTSAGALNVLTRQPTPYVESSGQLDLGQDDLREYRGSLSGPLLDEVLAARLSGFRRTRDGLVDNLNGGLRLNDLDGEGLRGQLLWTPDERFSARLIGERGDERQHGTALQPSYYNTQTRQRAEFAGYRLLPTDPYRREVKLDTLASNRVRQDGVSLELNWDLADDLRFTSLTANRDWRYRDNRDGDGTALSVVPLAATDLEHRQFSQEFRLAGSLDARTDYVVGLYYLRQRLDRDLQVHFGDDAAAWFLGDIDIVRQLGIGPAHIPQNLLSGATQLFDGTQRGDSRAAFGQVTWRPLERLELNAGLRYTRERKRGFISRRAVDVSRLGSDWLSQLAGPPLRELALGNDYYRHDSIEEGNLSGLLGMSYRFRDDVLGYVNWSRGYKAGGINFDVVGSRAAPTFGDERATSLEVGLKTRFWQDRARLDLALYQTDVDDYQALTTSPSEQPYLPPLRDNLINVGRVRMRGIELDSAWRLHPRLDGRFGLAWSDARYRRFADGPCAQGSAQVNCDLAGQRLYNAPEWSASAGLDYRHPLTAGLEAFGGLDYSFRSGYYGTLEGGPGSYQPAYGLTDLRLGVRRVDRRWEVEAWARNLFDRHYLDAVYATLGNGDYAVLPGDPRSLGLSLRARY